MRTIISLTTLTALLLLTAIITMGYELWSQLNNNDKNQEEYFSLVQWRSYLNDFDFTNDDSLATFSDSQFFASTIENWEQSPENEKFNRLKTYNQDDGKSIQAWKKEALNQLNSAIKTQTATIKACATLNKKRVLILSILIIVFLALWTFIIKAISNKRQQGILQKLLHTNTQLEEKQQGIEQRNKIMSSILQDLSDEKKRSNFSKINDQRLTLVAKYSDDCLIGLDEKAHITSWNPKAEKIFLKSESTMRHQPLDIIFDEDDREAIKSAIAKITVQSPHTSETIKWINTEKTQAQYLDASITGLFSDDQIQGYSVIIRDISSRIQEIEELRLLIEATPNAIIMSDANGNIVQANGHAEKTFLYPKFELLSLKIEDLVPDAAMVNHTTLPESYLASPIIGQMGTNKVLQAKRKDGVNIHVEVGLAPVNIDNKSFVISAITDISERIEAQENLKIFHDSLTQKNKEMEQFVYTVSHDLKAPLVTISAFSKSIKKLLSNADYERAAQKIDRVIANAEKMEELITDLLEISRIVNRPLTTTEISLTQVINDVLGTLEEILKGCTVSVDIQPNNLRLIANRAQITQCLQNIIGNSAKYKDPQKLPYIKILAMAEGETTKIVISDNGKGIAREYQTKIFDIFERGDTDTQGNGVGLAIVKSVIEKHQGTIQLVSQKDQGASFTLTLPKLKLQKN